jgi:hypothetical protein
MVTDGSDGSRYWPIFIDRGAPFMMVAHPKH